MLQEGDQTPESIVFLDFQTCRVASPITDLVYFLYICTNSALRKVHYNDLLDEYYAGFSEQVQALGLEIDEVFPKTVFQVSVKVIHTINGNSGRRIKFTQKFSYVYCS